MTLDALLAEREISRAVTRFARAMDDRDWAVLHEILLPDATAELGTGTLHGPAEVVALIRSYLDNCGPTQHLLGNQLIEVDGDKAVSRTYVSDMHLGVGKREGLSFCTLGDYHDQWARVDGVWRMSHRAKNMGGSLGAIEVFGGPSPADSSPVVPTADIEAIMQLKARYFRLMDTKDWDGLVSVFTADVVIDMTETGGAITRSVDEYMPFLRANIEQVTTVHHGHTPEIALTSSTTATGLWAMEDNLWWPEDSGLRHLRGYGHYHEEYRRAEDDGWRIAAMRLSRLHTVVT
ncbi:nuclear transport factor 2 family protein [Tomitella biformata]|uniref:nuclear transport factor 2 family protein n=1 Tax=Tomitella biformata TaxID=630403 RepID=UPI000570DCAA|nr:nuclear transport factor 2 family protein [Tomitella biformata]